MPAMNTHKDLLLDIHKDLIGRNLRPDQHHKSSRRILLTGGAGFIGSVLVRKLVLNYPEYLIVVVDKLDYCSSLNNLRPFLDDSYIKNLDTNCSQDTPITTTTTAPSPSPRTQTPDTLSPDAESDRRGHTIRGPNPSYPNFVFLEGDITDVGFIESTMVEYRINTIMHLAAQTHVDKSFGDSIDFTLNNVLGTHVLLEAARKYFGLGRDDDSEGDRAVEKRFIFVSTDEVYGEVPLGKSDSKEEDALAPSNPYSATKAAAECMVQAYHKSFKLPVIITRSNNVYGPFQYPEKIIPKFIMSLRPNSSSTTSTSTSTTTGSGLREPGSNTPSGHCYIHGSGRHSRIYLYVADAANALDVILHRGIIGEVYNIGAGHELSNIELAQDLIHRLVKPRTCHSKNRTAENEGELTEEGEVVSTVRMRQEEAIRHQSECRTCQELIEFVEDRAFNDQRYAVDSSRLRELGWSPRVEFEQGIVNTIEWFGRHGRTWWGDIHRALYPHSVRRSTSEPDVASLSWTTRRPSLPDSRAKIN